MEVRFFNNKPKLYIDVTDNFNVVVNKFDGNNGFYTHLNRKGKAISIPFDHLEELISVIPILKQKLSMLDTVSITPLSILSLRILIC